MPLTLKRRENVIGKEVLLSKIIKLSTRLRRNFLTLREAAGTVESKRRGAERIALNYTRPFAHPALARLIRFPRDPNHLL